MSITITKVKLIKADKKTGYQKADVHYKQDGKLKGNGGVQRDFPVHVDFINAVQALAVHLAILSGILPKKMSGDLLELEKYVVTGYSIGGDDDDPGITITGYRKGEYGVIILNSPFIKFEEKDGHKYSLIQDLINKVNISDAEAEEYVFNGKRAPEVQQSLNLPEVEDKTKTTVTVLPPDQDKNPFKDKKGNKVGDGGKSPATGVKIPAADPDAMGRVAAVGNDELNGKTKGTKKSGKK